MMKQNSDKSLRIIIEAAKFHPKLKMANVQTYEDLMYLPFGYWGSLFVQVNMVGFLMDWIVYNFFWF